MIKHFSLDDLSQSSLQTLTTSKDFVSAQAKSTSLLIQYFSASTDENTVSKELAELHNLFPNAVIVGATTIGEIFEGQLATGKQIASFTFFETTKLSVIQHKIEIGEEYNIGYQLGQEIKRSYSNTKAALLLATPLSIAAADLLNGIEDTSPSFELFGGGAGDYASLNNSLVMCGTDIYPQGAVAVLFEGPEFHVDSRTYLGWRSLSRPMNITKSNGMIVEELDNKPAFEVYRKYLNIPNDDNFFLSALEFPLLLERNNRLLARVPVGVTDSGGLIFVADLDAGETCRLGYGDPGLIVDGAQETYHSIEGFSPDVVFLYSCGCRRFLMQEDVELETLPVQNIAPTFGFYTYGEFFADRGKLSLLNSTMVAVSFREGQKRYANNSVGNKGILTNSNNNSNTAKPIDPYANKHARIVSRLVHFISATTSELEQANHAKSLFLANTSHELRTPLTAISGYAEAIINGDIEADKQTNAVKIIHQQSQHLLSLINDVLDLSKIEAQELTINTQAFDLLALIDNLTLLFQQQATNKSLSFEVKKSPNLPNYIITDQERLYQIMVNLCGNAIKFTNIGGVTIEVDYFNDKLKVQVIDTGIGLSEQQLQKIFLPFSQIISDKTDVTKGTGLGLSIAKHLINLLGGEITVSSVLNKGSNFSFTIEAKAETSIQPKALTNVPSQQSQGQILIAEDNVENGQLFKLLLENAGHKVDLVEDGAHAIELALINDYQLILLDIQMPKMDGVKAMQILSFSGISAPVVALTANAMTNDVQSYLQMGFATCISKPIQKDSFLLQINQLLQLTPPASNVEISPEKYQQLKASAIQSIIYESQIMSTLHSEQNHADLKKIAHKLKGLSAQFEMSFIAAICQKIESSDDDEVIAINLENLLQQVQKLTA